MLIFLQNWHLCFLLGSTKSSSETCLKWNGMHCSFWEQRPMKFKSSPQIHCVQQEHVRSPCPTNPSPPQLLLHNCRHIPQKQWRNRSINTFRPSTIWSVADSVYGSNLILKRGRKNGSWSSHSGRIVRKTIFRYTFIKNICSLAMKNLLVLSASRTWRHVYRFLWS